MQVTLENRKQTIDMTRILEGM